MSALVIIECNVCAAITPPWPTADRARHEAAPEGWAVDVDGSNVDYCPQCTAPAGPGRVGGSLVFGDPVRPESRLDVARRGVRQLRDAFAAIAQSQELRPTVMVSVANLARVRADALLEELGA